MLALGLSFRHYIEVVAIPVAFTLVLPFLMVYVKMQFVDYFPSPFVNSTCTPSSLDLNPVPTSAAISSTVIIVYGTIFSNVVCIFMVCLSIVSRPVLSSGCVRDGGGATRRW